MRLKHILVCIVPWLLPWLVTSMDSYMVDVCLICECNNDTYNVNCSKRSLPDVPADPTGRTVLLNMTRNRLLHITGPVFNTYKNLEVLDLSRTQLYSLSPNAFDGLASLKRLDLSINRRLPFIQNSTPESLFASLTSLEELKVFGNTEDYTHQGDSYPGVALAKLKRLSTIWMDGLSNASFDVQFRTMTELETIYLAGDRNIIWGYCNVPIISFAMLENLIHVGKFLVRACGIIRIESDAFSNMVELRILDLSENYLLTLNGATVACEGLSKTRIESFVLNHVNTLVSGCNASISREMTKELGKLIHLKEFHVEQNKISGFDKDAIANLPKSLEYVNMKRNAFGMGWYAFDSYLLPNLHTVDISFNDFVDRTSIWHTNHVNNDVCETREQKDDVNVQSNNDTRRSCRAKVAIEENAEQTQALVDGKDFEHAFNIQLSRSFSSTGAVKSPKHGTGVDDIVENDKVCAQPKIKLPPICITAFLPQYLKYVDISHSKLAHPIPEIYFDDDNIVRSLDASHSLLFCWDGPVHGLKHLEYLDLSTNLCSKIRLSFFDPLPNLKTLSIADNLLADTISHDEAGRLLKNLAKLENLDMSRNQIERIPSRFLIHQVNLQYLDVSINNLIEFEIQIDQFILLKSLNLHHNHITTLSENIRYNLTKISKSVYTERSLDLNLKHNSLHCTCFNRPFLNWVNDHMSSCQFLNITISRCMDDHNNVIKVKNQSDLGKVLKNLDGECNTYTSLIVVSGVSFCVIVCSFVAVVAYRFRWKMTYWYFVKSRDNLKSRSGYVSIENLGSSSSRFKFDLYVSSVENTRYFVLDNLKQILEGHNFRVFLQDDDIIPGQNIYSMIGNAIHLSRIVIFIVSDMCEENKEWRIAMRMAHEESLNRGYPIFFGVFVGESPDRYESKDIREIKQRPYLRYQDNTQPINEQPFWHDLVRNIKEMGGVHVMSMSEDSTFGDA